MDVVYTWVDGTDPEWQKKRQDAQLKQGEESLEPFATVNGRFRNNDELKYSLRSLEMHFPQHGQVYLVTDNQRPSWLSEKVRVIDHTAIMHGPLPTFSSKRIEANLWKIPGLSSRWLYLNDLFLGANFHLSDLLNAHGQIGVSLLPQTDGELSEFIAIQNSERWLGTCEKRAMGHGIRVVDAWLWHTFFKQFEKTFEIANQEIFRQKHIPSILSDMFGRWLLRDGFAFESKMILQYFETRNWNAQEVIQAKSTSGVFCINDTHDNEDGHHILSEVQETLERLYPQKSVYEK
jgi:hypothetical protein